MTLNTRNTYELSTKTTSYRDLKCLKAVHSQFSHKRVLRNYTVLSDNVICHPSTPFTYFCECCCFVLYKTILYVLKNRVLMPSHFTHKFKYVCYFQSHKITWTSYSIHKILSHLWRPSSICFTFSVCVPAWFWDSSFVLLSFPLQFLKANLRVLSHFIQ